MKSQDPRGLPATLMCAPYFRGHVIAVIDEQEKTEDAIRALQEAGFAAEALRLFSRKRMPEKRDEFLKHRSVAQRLGALLLSEELLAAKDYMEEMAAGGDCVSVRTPSAKQVESARKVLAVHHGHSMRHYGDWVITELG